MSSKVHMEVNVNWDYLEKATAKSLEEGMIKGGIDVLYRMASEAKGYAVFSGGKAYRVYRTGTLIHSLGVSFSRKENSRYGPKHTIDGRKAGSGGLPGARRGEAQLAFSTACGYGRWVHEGTSKTPGRPFMLNAVKKHGHLIREHVSREVKNALNT